MSIRAHHSVHERVLRSGGPKSVVPVVPGEALRDEIARLSEGPPQPFNVTLFVELKFLE